jgi:hypothetical protein
MAVPAVDAGGLWRIFWQCELHDMPDRVPLAPP